MRNTRIRAAAPLLALTLALGLGACGSETDEPGGETTPTESADPPADDDETSSDDSEETLVPADPTEQPPEGAPIELPTNDVPEDVIASDEVQAAITDLADRASVQADQVQVAGYFEVTWNDGSIGCPEPGMSYTQALVPGQLLVLEADGQQYSYHAGGKPDFKHCANPNLPNDLGDGAVSTS